MLTEALLHELTPVAEQLNERHATICKPWYPHEYVPWGLGRDFDASVPWDEHEVPLPGPARTALFVNLLTEDNLPSYHREIATRFGRDGAWGTWVHRWTAEEGQHAICMRDYLLVTRGVDPVELERGRMHQMQVGYSSDNKPILGVLAYVSFQELATRISHRNTGKYTEDPIADKLLARIAADENLHMIFYRNLLAAAFELEPNVTMRAVTDIVQNFQMPGHSIEGFTRKSVQIANAGIYDLRQHKDQVLVPILRQWKVWDIEGLDAEGEKARLELDEFLEGLEAAAARFEERRDERAARVAARV